MKLNQYKTLMSINFLLLILFLECASQHIRFKDAEPVRYFNDIHPIPVPEDVHYNVFDYYARSLPPLPKLKTLLISKNKNARDR